MIDNTGIILLAIALVALVYTQPWENFHHFRRVSHDANLPNKNAFNNYYRVGYHESRDIGWKPSDTWDHLRPESNIIPQCYDHGHSVYS